MSSLHNVLIMPHMTEKAATSQGELQEVAFRISSSADKIQVRRAIEEIFEVKVRSVRILTVHGKLKRLGRFQGRRPSWKKAIVTLAEGHTINLYEVRK